MPDVDLAALASELEHEAEDLRTKADAARRRTKQSDGETDAFIEEIAVPLTRLREIAGLPKRDVKASLRTRRA